MATHHTLGYGRAADKRPGDYVTVGGRVRLVLAVVATGKYAPCFKVDGPEPYFTVEELGPGWVSWLTCGDVTA